MRASWSFAWSPVVLGLVLACGGKEEEGGTGSGGSAASGGSSGGASSGGSVSVTGGKGTGGSSDGGGTSDGGSFSTGGSSDGGGTSDGGSFSDGGSGQGGSGGSGADCTEDCEGMGFICCDGKCVNPSNDIMNCGGCGVICTGDFPHCDGECVDAPCGALTDCVDVAKCCGSECCGEGQLCCMVNQGPGVLGCFDAVGGTCPAGCPMCECAAPDTPIATPGGEVPISELRIGDLVYSMDEHGIVVVPIERVNRTAVENHQVLSIVTEQGRTLRISPDHPVADGRFLSQLHPGDRLDGALIQSLTLVPYELSETYDILPASSTGTYFAGGVPLGSTLR